MKLYLISLLFILLFSLIIESKRHGIKALHLQHVHYGGIQYTLTHHSKYQTQKLIQPTAPLPLYSPPFVGVDNGQIPTIDQVALIIDWLNKITSTIDVFLRLQATYPDGSKEQKQMIKNVYPPLKVLLAANYAYEYKTGTTTE